jgi:catechol-2,3-dioxygenase
MSLHSKIKKGKYLLNIHSSIIDKDLKMKIKAANTILYCNKWQETVDFYRNGLKLPIISSTDWFVEFKLNESARLSVANAERTSIQSGDGRGITISLQVMEVEALRSELIQAGFNPSPVKEIWGSLAIYLHDPEGNRLEFWSGRAKA